MKSGFIYYKNIVYEKLGTKTEFNTTNKTRNGNQLFVKTKSNFIFWVLSVHNLNNWKQII